MADFVTLTCPSCGGKLQITNDIERFACGHCGSEHVVKRSGGIVALARVVEELAKVQTGVDKTAAELAIKRLQEEIKLLNDRYQQLNSERDGKIHQANVPLLNKKNEYSSLKDKPNWGFRVVGLWLIWTMFNVLIAATDIASKVNSLKQGLELIPLWAYLYVLAIVVLFIIVYSNRQKKMEMISALKRQIEEAEQQMPTKVKAIQSEMQSKIDAVDKELAKKQQELEDNRRLVSK